MTTPPLEYMLECSDLRLREFIVNRLNRAANLEKERRQIIEELTEALVEAEVARIMLDTRKQLRTGRPVQKSLDLEDHACGEVAAEFGATNGVRGQAAD
jgi:hypothetical protein